jgi:DNA polymerase I-like protein with 3'-5' exonuclease and polymerase domains
VGSIDQNAILAAKFIFAYYSETASAVWIADIAGENKPKKITIDQFFALNNIICITVNPENTYKLLLTHQKNIKIFDINTALILLNKKTLNPPTADESKNINLFFSKLKKYFVPCFQEIEKRNIFRLVHLELELAPVLIKMSDRGLPFNANAWKKNLQKFNEELEQAKKLLLQNLKIEQGFDLFGNGDFDLANHHQIKSSLEKTLGVKLKGTSAKELAHIDHPAVKALISFRELTRLIQA